MTHAPLNIDQKCEYNTQMCQFLPRPISFLYTCFLATRKQYAANAITYPRPISVDKYLESYIQELIPFAPFPIETRRLFKHNQLIEKKDGASTRPHPLFSRYYTQSDCTLE